MKRTFSVKMASAVLLTALGAGVAVADSVRSRNAQSVVIKFDEPVVSLGVVENGWNDDLPAETRGLNIFDITGDPQYTPEARWVDQDELMLTFVKGTSAATKYRLAFRPGSDQYLSGARMPEPAFEFSPEPAKLRLTDILPGVPGGAACVVSRVQVTREQMNLSPASPIRYSFREVLKNYPRRYGRSVPGVASALQVKHLSSRGFAELLSSPAEYGITGGPEGLKKLSTEHVIPGHVLVTPSETLDSGKNWELYAEAEEGSGFYSNPVSSNFTPVTDLASGISLQLVRVENSSRLQMTVRFAAPVAEKDVESIFRNMDICVGDRVAVTAEDGKVKTLSIGEKTLTFRLLPLPENRVNSYYAAMHRRNGETKEENVRLAYDLPYTDQFLIEIEGADELPVTADVVLKAGTVAMLGQPMTTDHRHRITINAAAPVLCFNHTPANPALLPLKGDHCLRLECLNQAEMQLSVAHLSAEQYIRHYRTFDKINEEATDNYAELIYTLQVLQKRLAAGLEKEKEAEKTIKFYTRRLEQLRKNLPDYDALRKTMQDVSFGKVQRVETAGQGPGALKSAELAVDLDALHGTPAGPGVYLISVRSQAAPNVRAALRELGLEETIFDCEVWYAVQLTDLHIINAGKTMVSNSLSTGIPTAEGKVLDITSDMPSPIAGLQDGVAVLPSVPSWENKRPELMLRSGDDYRTISRYISESYADEDRRILLMKDRSMYRPGERVHLRGVLRSVSSLGEPSLPKVKSVDVIVSRPNSKELVRQKIQLNDYGAFDFDFTLPEGDEDIVGAYRIQVQADGHNYSETDVVQCQEFRRDAFTTKNEITMQPVRPEEFTYTVTAEDLNGVPLSGAKAHVKLNLYYGNHAPEIPGEKKVAPHLKSESWSETLTLNDEGKAIYTKKIPYLHREALMNGTASLTVRGHVTNDREETMRLQGVGRDIYPADFRIVLQFYSDDTITLYSNTGSPEKASEVLQRDQVVSLRLVSQKAREEVLPNGIILITMEPVTLWQGEVTVPANSVNGVATGVKQHCEAFFKSQGGERPPVYVEFRARDAAGNELQQWSTIYHYHAQRCPQSRERRDATCKVEGRSLSLSATFEQAGQASVVINSVTGARAAASVPVQKGANTWNIPLLDKEYGEVNVAVMLPVQADGRYTNLEYTTVSAAVERPQNKLGVQLNLPPTPPRPGAELTLSGSITTPDGKQLPEAEVTLFAVDKGMLSVSVGHRVANPGTYFTRVNVSEIYPQMAPVPAPLVLKPGERSVSPLQGIWQGDIVGPGQLLEDFLPGGNVRYARGAALYKAAGAVNSENGAICEDAICSESVDLDGAPAPQAVRRNFKAAPTAAGALRQESAPAPVAMVEETGAAEAPRLRTNFVPVAVWAPSLKTDAEGKFSVQVKLPDTLTTYQVYTVALAQDGKCFGYAENEFTVNQPVMLTPGTPLFMSLGDRLRLPLTITNNTDAEGTWTVKLEGADAPQQITLKAKSTATLYFDYTAAEEGERKLRWEALAAAGSDAVEGSFEVKFPSPVLREAHRLVLQEGSEALKVGALPAPELADSTRGKVEIQLSANPLLHLNECMELTLNRGFGNTEWYATSLLPWMLHERMSPFSPAMAAVSSADARKTVIEGVKRLARCQREDGGMGYWPSDNDFCRYSESSPWASAYAGLVLTIAQDNGFVVPEETLPRLRKYLTKYLDEQRKEPEVWAAMSPHILYAAGRTLEDETLVGEALERALNRLRRRDDGSWGLTGPYHPRACCLYWFNTSRSAASLTFLAEMHKDKEARHASFLKWMRCVGHDYRHATTWDGGWMLLALHEYLRLTPAGNAQARITLENGQQLTLGNGPTEYTPAPVPTLGEIPTVITRTEGSAYVSVKFRAQPAQTEYPGVTEKGLQVTRIYEKRGEDGAWRPATEFNVGDVVRVTLTCAKGEKDLEYFVLEDYLPSNMEAINPAVRSQSVGLEWQPWSRWFDNREFQSHRLRGFCTRWCGRALLNMSYYARVKRAGEAMAPPASAQLMYEPQTYGLSPNTKVISR